MASAAMGDCEEQLPHSERGTPVHDSSGGVPDSLEEFILPLPACDEEKGLTCKREFSLPPDWLPKTAARRSRSARKPHPFREIKRNIFVSRPRMQSSTPACLCAPTSGCGERCINRIMQIICNRRTCPCGDTCTNQSLGKRPAPPLEVVDVGARGFGLRTPVAIKKGSFLGEYCGELIDIPEAARRVREYYIHTKNYYFLDYDAPAGEVLDAGLRGSRIRFVNHSVRGIGAADSVRSQLLH